MSELKGTEKQIKWAEKIRKSFLDKAKADYERRVFLHEKIMNVAKTEEQIEREKKVMDKETYMYNYMVDKYNNETRATWFIQMQDRPYNYLFNNYRELEKMGRL